MYWLIFHRNNQPMMRYELKEETVTIGRDPSCNIQLVEDEISRIHAVVSCKDGSYAIANKGTNGTLINDERIQNHILSSDDTITIGEWKIRFEKEAESQQEATFIKDISPTKILKYESNKKELTSESIELTVASEKIEKKGLGRVSLGTAPSNDIVIANDPYVSSQHCIIKCREGHFILEDVGSTNGTIFNGEKVSRITLPENGEFTIGKTPVRFLIRQNAEKIMPSPDTSLGPIIGASEGMRELFSLVSKIAPSDATICIIGESGTGKELFARYIHETSQRRAKPFIAINCGAIPENLIESELFGHERGAFTSATTQHKGVFEQADAGTLFLDEIGEMPLDLQTRLLRALETRQIRRVGGQSDIEIDVRIIAATNQDLKKLVKTGRFRNDLFFRLYIVPVFLPPLRERKEDIPLIAEHLLKELTPSGLSRHLGDGAMNKLLAYDWPGNVRELRNTIQRAILVAKDSTIIKEDITFSELGSGETEHASLDDQEYKAVLNALKRSNGNVSEAARLIGVARTTLTSMVKRFKIDIKDLQMNK